MVSALDQILTAAEDDRAEAINALSPDDATHLIYLWEYWAREKQLPPPGSWATWVIMAGRGFGKTRTGAEFIRGRVEAGEWSRVALVGRTPADIRDVMVQGESGLLAISPPDWMPTWEPTKRKLTWPNGAFALTFSGANPDELRGPQFDGAWVDELSAFKYPLDTWDNLSLALRLGTQPQCVVTMTPKPISMVRELVGTAGVAVTRGTTFENRANLSERFFTEIVSRYEGTRTGMQEIYAELLEETEGALWKRTWLDATRIQELPRNIRLRRVVVAIDPATTSKASSDETGIVVAGIGGPCPCNSEANEEHGFLLSDASGRYSPDGWANKALELYTSATADRIIAEVNNGGDMVEATLRTVDRSVPYKAVYASRGKATRAEPVAALYQQGRIHHVGVFPGLEDQLCNWEPLGNNPSPDRLDATVWAFTELMLPGTSWLAGGISGGKKQSAWTE